MYSSIHRSQLTSFADAALNRGKAAYGLPPVPHSILALQRRRALALHSMESMDDKAALRRIPYDAVILSLSVMAALLHPAAIGDAIIAATLAGLLALYWIIALRVPHPADYGPRAVRLQSSLLGVLIAALVVLPTVVAINYRHRHQPYNAIHDSPLQIELATQMLLRGQDYYRATYFHTPLAMWWPQSPPNPALYHTDSLPFQEELTVPALLLARATLGWFDERFIYLASLAVALALAASLARTRRSRLALAGGLALNPLFVPTFIAGQNDILILAEVLALLALARRGRYRAALLMLGTALATKETVVFLLPFLLLWIGGRLGLRTARDWGRWLPRALGWIALPVLLFVGPFVLWDARALYDSTIGFVEGTVPHAFPIRGLEGYGFASFVLFGRLVRSSADYWPFGLAQALTAGLVALLLLWRQYRDNSLTRAVAGYATTLFIAYYFGRFDHASFIAFSLSVCMVAMLLDVDRPSHLSAGFLLALLIVPQALAQPTTPALAIIAAVVMGALVLYALGDALTDGWTALPGRARQPASAEQRIARPAA